MTRPNELLVEGQVERHLQKIAHIPDKSIKDTWLRALLELLRFEKVQSSGWRSEYLKVSGELQQTRAELSAKDKVLEAYAVAHDGGWSARKILSQYRGESE